MNNKISTHLKNSTAGLHEDVEARLGAILFRENLQPLEYQQLLENMHAVYFTLENMIGAVPDMSGHIRKRAKLEMLLKDLAFLEKITGKPVNLDQTFTWNTDFNKSRAWGMMYVMEGATLGGAVIMRQLAGHTWVSDECIHFFRSYGDSRGRMWTMFTGQLENYYLQNPDQKEDILEGACDAFRFMKQSLARHMIPY